MGAMPADGGRGFTVIGLDCAEEVAVLKRAIGPLVGGADELGFDVLNGRMIVPATKTEVTDQDICGQDGHEGGALAWATQ